MKRIIGYLALGVALSGCATAEKLDTAMNTKCASAITPANNDYISISEINEAAQHYRCKIAKNENVDEKTQIAYENYAIAYNKIISRRAQIIHDGSERAITSNFCSGLGLQTDAAEENLEKLHQAANPQQGGALMNLIFDVMGLIVGEGPELIEAYTSASEEQRVAVAEELRASKISNTNWNTDGCAG